MGNQERLSSALLEQSKGYPITLSLLCVVKSAALRVLLFLICLLHRFYELMTLFSRYLPTNQLLARKLSLSGFLIRPATSCSSKKPRKWLEGEATVVYSAIFLGRGDKAPENFFAGGIPFSRVHASHVYHARLQQLSFQHRPCDTPILRTPRCCQAV